MNPARASRLSDFSLSSVTAGFVAVLVGYTASAALIFQAALAAGASTAELGSWLGSLSIGMGLTTIGLSLYYRAPILTAWSTPGAALLAGSLGGVPIPEAIGAFVFCAILITLSGLTGWFEKIMDRIPQGIAAAMLAGVRLQFGMGVFVSMQTQFTLVLAMFMGYLLCRRFTARYAIVGVLALGVVIAGLQGSISYEALALSRRS